MGPRNSQPRDVDGLAPGIAAKDAAGAAASESCWIDSDVPTLLACGIAIVRGDRRVALPPIRRKTMDNHYCCSVSRDCDDSAMGGNSYANESPIRKPVVWSFLWSAELDHCSSSGFVSRSSALPQDKQIEKYLAQASQNRLRFSYIIKSFVRRAIGCCITSSSFFTRFSP